MTMRRSSELHPMYSPAHASPTLRKISSNRQISARLPRSSLAGNDQASPSIRSPSLRRPSSTIGGLRSASSAFCTPRATSRTSLGLREPSSIGSNGASSSMGLYMNENVTVAVRVVPRTEACKANNCCWDYGESNGKKYINASAEVACGLAGKYVFDHFYDEHATNEDVYTASVASVVKKVIEGFNATIFAYGMTGTGKTYSMNGTIFDKGIIPRAMNDIFTNISTEQQSWNVNLSYLEIYNEKIQDLLAPNDSIQDLKIREDAENGVHVAGAVQVEAKAIGDVAEVLKSGAYKRRTAQTDSNAHSSRSHAILRVLLNINGRKTYLNLIDLAGSERASSEAERRKEGSYINKSLLTLGTVISKLTSSSNPEHIPYRDSKLTRLLQDSLNGSSYVCLLATISTLNEHVFETTNTLKFASRVKFLPSLPKFHQPEKTPQVLIAENKKLTAENDELRRTIEQLRSTIESNATALQNIQRAQAESPTLVGVQSRLSANVNKLENQLLERDQEIVDLRKVLQDKAYIIETLRESLSQLQNPITFYERSPIAKENLRPVLIDENKRVQKQRDGNLLQTSNNANIL